MGLATTIITVILALVAAYVVFSVLSIVYGVWKLRRALNGKYGDAMQWTAEFLKDKDRAFIEAAKHLPRHEQRELGIIADTKDEFREATIERAKEYGFDEGKV